MIRRALPVERFFSFSTPAVCRRRRTNDTTRWHATRARPTPCPPQGSIYHKRRDTANGPRPVQHNHPMQGRRAGQRAIASWGDQGGVTRSGPFPPPFRDGLRSRRMAESREKTGELGDVMLRSGADGENWDSGIHSARRGLTRHKISDRARERASPHTGRTNYTKVTHRSGARFAASPG